MKRRGIGKEGEISEGEWRVREEKEGGWIPRAVLCCPFLWKVSICTFALFCPLYFLASWILLLCCPSEKPFTPRNWVVLTCQLYFPQFFITLTPTPFALFSYGLSLHFTLPLPETQVSDMDTDENLQYSACRYIHTYTSRGKYAHLSSGIRDLQFIFKHSIFRLQSFQLVIYQRYCKRKSNRDLKKPGEKKKRARSPKGIERASHEGVDPPNHLFTIPSPIHSKQSCLAPSLSYLHMHQFLYLLYQYLY